jgi:hypothetical protein
MENRNGFFKRLKRNEVPVREGPCVVFDDMFLDYLQLHLCNLELP